MIKDIGRCRTWLYASDDARGGVKVGRHCSGHAAFYTGSRFGLRTTGRKACDFETAYHKPRNLPDLPLCI